MEELQTALAFILAFLALLVAIYIGVRVGAVAWFRSKRESAHRMMRELRGDDLNGTP